MPSTRTNCSGPIMLSPMKALAPPMRMVLLMGQTLTDLKDRQIVLSNVPPSANLNLIRPDRLQVALNAPFQLYLRHEHVPFVAPGPKANCHPPRTALVC